VKAFGAQWRPVDVKGRLTDVIASSASIGECRMLLQITRSFKKVDFCELILLLFAGKNISQYQNRSIFYNIWLLSLRSGFLSNRIYIIIQKI